ncbi:MAG: hypothetical protein EXR55_01870 [Dehalococcoidia bacterium]|nr:hypothetical protein [Dehalococcoidia bacterium]
MYKVRWGVLGIGAAVLLALLGLGCYNSQLASQWVRGSQFSMGVGALRVTDQVVFTKEGKDLVVRPAEGQTLVAIPIRLRNDRTGKALLLINEDAALLRDRAGRQYTPVDPFARAVALDGSLDQSKVVAPFLWGKISLDQNYQLSGWLLFEALPNREWQELEWRQGDTIVARFGGYP